MSGAEKKRPPKNTKKCENSSQRDKNRPFAAPVLWYAGRLSMAVYHRKTKKYSHTFLFFKNFMQTGFRREKRKISKEVVVAGENVWYNRISIVVVIPAFVTVGLREQTRSVSKGKDMEGIACE